MSKKLIIAIMLFVFGGSLFAQTPSAAISSAEKFNRRGFIENDGIQVSGKEVISDYDGNLMLQYSTPIDLMDDLSGSFTITYNANVEHRVMKDPQNSDYGAVVNYPEWILGYKGFALQVMNFERRLDFVSKQDTSNYYGQEISMLVSGYHISNNLLFGTAHSQKNDIIKILRSDGSKLSLMNVEVDSYSGVYVDKTPGNNGFAIVKVLDTSDVYQQRGIWYKPGNGLTYYFEEEKIELHCTYCPGGQQRNVAKGAYLKKIFNAEGYEVQFTYTTTPAAGITLDKGRKAFQYINSTRLSSLNSQLGINYVKSSSYETLDLIEINNYNQNDDKLRFYVEKPSHYTFSTSNYGEGLSGSVSDQHSRIIFFDRVVHNTTREDTINYYDSLSTNFIDRDYSFGTTYNFTLDAYLIKDINYFNGRRTEFSYYSEGFNDHPEWDYPGDSLLDGTKLNLELSNQSFNNNIELTYRDCFNNFMIKNKKVYDEVDNEIYSMTYEYKKDNGIEYLHDYYVTGIMSKVTQSTTQDYVIETLQTPTNLVTIKNYSKYSVGDLDYSNIDKGSVIKLISETFLGGSSSDKTVTEFIYDEGTLEQSQVDSSWYFHNGTFFIEQKDEKKYQSSVLKTTLTNQYFDTTATLSLGSVVTKKIKTSSRAQDPKTLNTHKKFKNFVPGWSIPASFTDETAFYLTGLTEEERIYSGSLTKSHVKNEFHDTTAQPFQVGKLKKQIVNPDKAMESSREYNYFSTGYYSGQLQGETVTGKNLANTYLYPATLGSRTLGGAIVKYDGTSQHSDINLSNGWQLKPGETNVNSAGYIFTYKSLFDPKGNLLVETDISGYISNYEYDSFGRMINASLPGSFTAFSLDSTNYSTIYTYDDVNNKVSADSRFNNDPSALSNYSFRNEYDVLGRAGKSLVNNVLKKETDYYFNGQVFSEREYYQTDQFRERVFEYDYLNRVTKVFYFDTLGFSIMGVPKIQNTYTLENGTVGGISYVEKNEFTDEEGKKTFSYFDKAGNRVAERKVSESESPTLFFYNDIYQLDSVKTPLGITTTYKYDENENVIEKTSPDFGTYKYMYDKFNRLRFEYHTGEQELVFHNYDPVDRLLETGVIDNYSQASFDTLDADTTNGFESDVSKHVLVNVYDDYNSTGVFSDLTLPQGFSMDNLKGKLAASAYRDRTDRKWSYKFYSYDHLGRIKEQKLLE